MLSTTWVRRKNADIDLCITVITVEALKTQAMNSTHEPSDLETSRIGAPYIYIYIHTHIHIYDISCLRVNDLTLVLLTWKKW